MKLKPLATTAEPVTSTRVLTGRTAITLELVEGAERRLSDWVTRPTTPGPRPDGGVGVRVGVLDGVGVRVASVPVGVTVGVAVDVRVVVGVGVAVRVLVAVGVGVGR